MHTTARRAAASCIAPVLVALASWLSAAAVAAAPASTTFGLQPAGGPGDTRTALAYGLDAGGSASDRVAVLNYSRQALPIRVYGADAYGQGDQFTLAAAGVPAKGVGAWLAVHGRRSVVLTVPAARVDADGTERPGRVEVPVDVAVPLTATPGHHAGGVVVSLDADAVDAGRATGVVLQQRVALRVYVDVADTGRPSPTAARSTAAVSSVASGASLHPLLLPGLIASVILAGLVIWRTRQILVSRRNTS